ncbi:hypothetical protein FJZ31_03575 [Candidatus Poribacteria bacterium]|nr:hypothetical protein [Candidatus Poribacteria bacterium]
MRLVLHAYADGDYHIYETTDDGKSLVRNIEGRRRLGERISTFVEMACADGTDGYEEALNVLRRLTEEIESRQKTKT